jgi:hypothetical protein
MCVGDVRLASLDVGFDLRLQRISAVIPWECQSIGLDYRGKTWLVTGPRDELIVAARHLGYTLVDPDEPAHPPTRS